MPNRAAFVDSGKGKRIGQAVFRTILGRYCLNRQREKIFLIFFDFVLDSVRYIAYIVNMTMIRKAIKKRMNELKLTTNQLTKMLKGKIPRRTIYDFLSGETDARTEVASELLKVLGIELISKKHKTKKAGERCLYSNRCIKTKAAK
jgi:hypothetical protein